MQWADALSALQDPWLDDAAYLNILEQIERSLDEPENLQGDAVSRELFGQIVSACQSFLQTTSSEEVHALAPASLKCFRAFLHGEVLGNLQEVSTTSSCSTGAWTMIFCFLKGSSVWLMFRSKKSKRNGFN
jgi:hypothetical protein